MNRDFNAEARALPEHDFDLLMHRYMLRAFQPWLNGVSALELGCYHGAFTKLIRDVYPDVTVVEASAECIAAARGIGREVEFIHSAFETVDLDRKFDAIFLIHTLEHLDDPVQVLKRCREWLQPEGRIFVAVPNAFAASRQLAVAMGIVESAQAVTAAEATHGHKRTYSLYTLSEDCQNAGLSSVDRGGVFFKPVANFQFDKALQAGIIDGRYLEACYWFGKSYPELCASVYVVCGRGA